LAGSDAVTSQTPAWGGRLSRSQTGFSGQADELAQVESGGGHTQLEVGFGQAGAFGVTRAEEVGQVEDDAFDERALLDVLLELLGLVVLQRGQNVVPMVADKDLAMGFRFTIKGAAVGQARVGG
jgi:hypothetical protein